MEASKDIKELAPEVNDAAYDFLVNEKGMKVNTLTDEQWLEFQKAAKPVWKAMEATIGAEDLDGRCGSNLGLIS